ncbi:SKI family transcriptional corepressor 2-like isoform X2 [Eriocheir sinensis]|uniref:SKI family transcriptional corepressor 2-like isoform X2 n=2 Tax=Eriocheir sinensis TaxID=95602 RepID=UPI0021C777B4|nr:SKI family transcriptional corepressor 2-like isoform X2 [Eriocheir sinensis]
MPPGNPCHGLQVCGDPGCGGWLPHSLLQPLTAVPQEPDTICFTPAQTLPLTHNSCFILRISDVEPAVPPPPPPPPGEPLTATRRKEAGRRRRRRRKRRGHTEREEEEEEEEGFVIWQTSNQWEKKKRKKKKEEEEEEEEEEDTGIPCYCVWQMVDVR